MDTQYITDTFSLRTQLIPDEINYPTASTGKTLMQCTQISQNLIVPTLALFLEQPIITGFHFISCTLSMQYLQLIVSKSKTDINVNYGMECKLEFR